MLQAPQLIICHSKSKIYKNFGTAITRNKRNMLFAILLSFFITYFIAAFKNFQAQYRQRHIQSPMKDLRCSFWQQQLTFPVAYSERSPTSKIKLFEKNILSRPLFQPLTLYTKSSILDIPLCSEYASGTINHRLCLGVWLCLRYTSDMFKERQRNPRKTWKVIFLETLQQRLKIITKTFLRKTLPRNYFLHSCFKESCS